MTCSVLGVQGVGELGRRVQRYSARPEIPEPERWVHVGALFPTGRGWHVIDASMNAGVREISLEQFERETKGEWPLAAFPYPQLSIDCLRTWIGRRFCLRKFYNFKRDRDWPETDGVTCGELLALCDGGVVANWSERPPVACRSVDYQAWALAHRIPMVGIGG